MEILEVNPQNLQVYLNLAQCYEAEFSVLTRKKPNKEGLYQLDTEIAHPTKGYLLYVDKTPVGLAAVGVNGDSVYEICEFYIIPNCRKEGLGMKFAHEIWRMLPGKWEVKQIEGADHAIKFWRNCIHRYPHHSFSEDIVKDPYWGQVNRHTFVLE